MVERTCTIANLQATINASDPGDVITITDAGTLTSAVTVTVANLTIQASDAGMPTIQAGTNQCVAQQADDLTIQGLRLVCTASNGSCVSPSSGAYSCTLRNCVLTAAAGGVRYSTATRTGATVLGSCTVSGAYLIRDGGSTGTLLITDSTISVTSSTVAAIQANAIAINMRRCRVSCVRLLAGHNDFSPVVSGRVETSLITVGSATDPSMVLRGASDLAMVRDTVVLLGPLAAVHAGSLTLEACGLLGGSVASVADGTIALTRCGRWNCTVMSGITDTYPVTDDPLMGEGYRPARLSPWRDAGGAPDLAEDLDLDGRPALFGAAQDIGCYEWQVSVPILRPDLDGWIVAVDGTPLAALPLLPGDGGDPEGLDPRLMLLSRVAISLIAHRGHPLHDAGSDLHLLRTDPRDAASRATLMAREALRWLEAEGGRIDNLTATVDGGSLRLSVALTLPGYTATLEGTP